MRFFCHGRTTQGLRIPVTAKIRIFPDLAKTVEYARMVERAGAWLVAVHGRLREQKVRREEGREGGRQGRGEGREGRREGGLLGSGQWTGSGCVWIVWVERGGTTRGGCSRPKHRFQHAAGTPTLL